MIVYDVQALQSAAYADRGIARYVGDLAQMLERRHPGLVDIFAWNDALPFAPRLAELGLGDRLRSFAEIRGLAVDIVHVTSPFEPLPLAVAGVPVSARRTVVTCYDLIPEVYSHIYLADPRVRAAYRARLGRLVAADAIVTDSESAASDVIRLLGYDPSRISSIGAGVGEQFVPPCRPLAERLADLRTSIPDLRSGYVLVPTGMDWRKNIHGALRSYAKLPDAVRRRHQLAVACRMSETERDGVRSIAVDLGIDDDLVLTGGVSDADLVGLYQSAELVFFPSFYEGFGLPVLEARRCGARVICSNTASLPEIVDDPVATFNPFDQDDMAATLEAALTDPATAVRLDRVPDRGFSWERSSDQLAVVYDGVRSTIVADDVVRDRVAVVTLLPPTLSGIADHSVALLRELQQRADVTAFVANAEPTATGSFPFDVAPLATLPSRVAAHDFDHVVYCFGNNPFHASFVPMLEQVPGHVLLHDVRLVGCLGAAEERFAWRRDPDDHPPADGSDADASLGVRSVVRRAVEVLVQSHHAAALVERATGREAINVGPIGHRRPSAPPVDGGSPLIVSAGVASETKQTAKVVAAFEAVTAQLPHLAAVVVGPDGERFAPAGGWGDDVRVLPGTVHSTGAVSETSYGGWLASAMLAVQLRDQTNGESSAAVADLLSHGIPCVVSDLGTMRELPDDVVVKVPRDISVDDLAAIVVDVVRDDDRRAALAAAGRAYAERHGFAAQAEAVLATLRSTQRRRRARLGAD